MGYACPDSGPGYSANCQSNKAGFYKQMTYAAWQLRYYYDHMGSYNYTPGQWNTIQYNPNPSCGTKDVYIENYATASLYIYTPYTPNDAALNAYPGQAPCGAYGNRNFWFFWQEWFGPTLTNGNFLRSANDATVYLVGDKVKYPISDMGLMSAASALGGVGFVSQSYLDTIPTGSLLGRFIRGTDGSIYFYDANIKLPFTSCEMVSAYGGSCGQVAQLTQAQTDRFVTGPLMTKGMKTTSGHTYYINGGIKREILDAQSQREAGLSLGYNVLNDSAFSYMAYGQPLVRKDVVIQSRQNGAKKFFNDGSTNIPLSISPAIDHAFSAFSTGQLDNQSIDQLPISSQVIKGSVTDEQGNMYILAHDGKKLVPDPQSFGGISSVALPASTVAKIPGTGSLTSVPLIKSFDDGTVYAIVGGQKRPLVAMEDLPSITGQPQPYIAWVSSDLVNAIPTGNIIVGAGRLVKTPSNDTVYMTDGYNNLIPMSSFDPARDLGISLSIRVISDDILTKYTVSSAVLEPYVSCSQINYLGMGGTGYRLDVAGALARPLQDQTCNVLNKATDLPGFVLTPNGTIYQFKDGKKNPISSWSKYAELSQGGGKIENISWSTAGLIPTGNTL
jgi:hypothetical protein